MNTTFFISLRFHGGVTLQIHMLLDICFICCVHVCFFFSKYAQVKIMPFFIWRVPLSGGVIYRRKQSAYKKLHEKCLLWCQLTQCWQFVWTIYSPLKCC